MKYALINPNWSFGGSTYFGCREAHLPLEFGYARALLESAGHTVDLIDGQLESLSTLEIARRVADFAPDFAVLTTAPSYLFWRCPPPELRVPMEIAAMVRDYASCLVVVGPHASTTPRSCLAKLRADVAVLGECEEVLANLTQDWSTVPSIAYFRRQEFMSTGGSHVTNMESLPALRWDPELLQKHGHHHHRFDRQPDGPGAEMEVSRGCPYKCTFCAKEKFRTDYRRRSSPVILDELDGLIAAGATYVYFIDEIFLPWAPLLEEVAKRKIAFGVQTRIDLWTEEMLALLGRAGCVSIEAGVESVSAQGRDLLAKKCRMTTAQLIERLIFAKQHVPFVQANLIEMRADPPEEVEAFRHAVLERGVWANQPVPLFRFPGSPDYRLKWGEADDRAWERAHEDYLSNFAAFSDIQDERPLPLHELEGVDAR